MSDIVIKINTGNDAFIPDETQEIKRILSNDINKIGIQDFVVLFDINGNKVGTIERLDNE
tara:strand:- start:34 stop:213 length:180 start_codon:yes stop_codon:yes gene_type:complete